MSYEMKPGDASAWKGDGAGGRPIYKLKCCAHRAIAQGEEFEVALWPPKFQEVKEGQPTLTGSVSDVFVPQKQQGHMSREEYARSGADKPVKPDFDDLDGDIPGW